MKSFKVKISDDKYQFFIDLMKNLQFVEYEEVDGFHEPRVYPGANFEIRSSTDEKEKERKKESKVSSKDEEGMNSIRSVLEKIEKQREGNKD